MEQLMYGKWEKLLTKIILKNLFSIVSIPTLMLVSDQYDWLFPSSKFSMKSTELCWRNYSLGRKKQHQTRTFTSQLWKITLSKYMKWCFVTFSNRNWSSCRAHMHISFNLYSPKEQKNNGKVQTWPGQKKTHLLRTQLWLFASTWADRMLMLS